MNSVDFLVPAGPIGTIVKCPVCENLFKKAAIVHTFCTMRCKKRAEQARKRQRDLEQLVPRMEKPKGDIIWDVTQELLEAYALVLRTAKDPQRGFTFGGPGVKELKIPEDMLLVRSADIAEVWNMFFKQEEVAPVAVAKHVPRSPLDIARETRERLAKQKEEQGK